MPKPPDLPAFRGFRRPQYTPTPDEVFDELLPQLSGSELKVLLYIIRRTFGFKKDADSISLSQLSEGIVTKDGRRLDYGTGMPPSSVIRARDSLIARGIIEAVKVRTAERGDETTVYRLHLQNDSPPDLQNTSPPTSILELAPLAKQEAQETVVQDTEYKNGSAPPENPRPPIPPAIAITFTGMGHTYGMRESRLPWGRLTTLLTERGEVAVLHALQFSSGATWAAYWAAVEQGAPTAGPRG